MTRPFDTDLAGDTDLFIRAVAERADAKMAGAIRFVVDSPWEYTTNGNGDITVPFAGLATITGALVMVAGKSTGISQWPAPGGGWTNSVILPVSLHPWRLRAGAVDAKLMIGVGYQGTGSSGSQGVKPVPNQKVTVAGVAWGPA